MFGVHLHVEELEPRNAPGLLSLDFVDDTIGKEERRPRTAALAKRMPAEVAPDHRHEQATPLKVTPGVIIGKKNERSDPPPRFVIVLEARGPAIGTYMIARNHTEKTKSPHGYFLLIGARSYHNFERPSDDMDHLNGNPLDTPYRFNHGYSTRPTSRYVNGARFSATAITQVSVTDMRAGTYTWSGNGSHHGIGVSTSGGFPNEHAQAAVAAFDPGHFDDVKAGEGFSVNYSDDGSWSYLFPDHPDAAYKEATVNISGGASTNISGLGQVFSYAISLHSVDLEINVSFSSNPATGLDNDAIAEAIANGYSWDPWESAFEYNGPSLSVGFTASAAMSDGVIYTYQNASLDMIADGCYVPRGVSTTCPDHKEVI